MFFQVVASVTARSNHLVLNGWAVQAMGEKHIRGGRYEDIGSVQGRDGLYRFGRGSGFKTERVIREEAAGALGLGRFRTIRVATGLPCIDEVDAAGHTKHTALQSTLQRSNEGARGAGVGPSGAKV